MTEEQLTVRKKLENYVYSYNTSLKEVIPFMSCVMLLRNAHPIYRPDFARDCEKVGLISRQEAEEFVKIVKIPS